MPRRKASTAFSAMPASSGASPGARCASAPTWSRFQRRNARSPRQTATLSGGKGQALEPTWQVRQWRPRRHWPAISSMCAEWSADMEPFRVLRGIAAPMLQQNIDTDIIIRVERLVSLERDALGPWAFESWRYGPNGVERPDFILNQEPYRDAAI